MKLIQNCGFFKKSKIEIELNESEYMSYQIGFINGIGLGIVVGSFFIAAIVVILVTTGILK